MTEVTLREVRNYFGGFTPITVDTKDVIALQSINNSVTVNLKNGSSVGLPYQEPMKIFNLLAAAMTPEEAEKIKVSLLTYEHYSDCVKKAATQLTLDHFNPKGM